MDQQMGMAKQMMDLQRMTFDGMVTNMITFWDQTDKVFGTFIDQAAWVPAEGKTAFKKWIDGNKKGCETFKKAVNDGYERLESYFAKGESSSQQRTGPT